MVEDAQSDLVDIIYYCCWFCAQDDPQAGAWPGGMETDGDVYCVKCGHIMWRGLREGE
jgi:hypothetical protein